MVMHTHRLIVWRCWSEKRRLLLGELVDGYFGGRSLFSGLLADRPCRYAFLLRFRSQKTSPHRRSDEEHCGAVQQAEIFLQSSMGTEQPVFIERMLLNLHQCVLLIPNDEGFA